MLAKVTSLFDLFNKAATDKRYELLAMIAARNLGGDNIKTLEDARRWLDITASDSGDCQGVVGEVNFCRDLVPDDDKPKKPAKRKINVEKLRRRLEEFETVNYVGRSMVLTEARELSEQTGQPIITAQQQPADGFVPISDDFVLDSFSITNHPTDPLTRIQQPIGGSVSPQTSNDCPLCDAGIPLARQNSSH